MPLGWFATSAILVVLGAPPDVPAPIAPKAAAARSRVTCGYMATKLLLPPDILPSCLAVRPDGNVAVGSMDGDILLALDTDRDGDPDRYRRWAGTLPHWPLGLLAEGDDLILATRSALLRLSDADGDGWAERWVTLTDAWDVTRDHHDWTTGVARWSGPGGGWVVSPVTDDVRERSIRGRHFLRGKAIRVAPDGQVSILADGLRYPTGWATRPTDGAIFFTDNQGQQKTTCEIQRLVKGGWYGYPSQADPPARRTTPAVVPAVRIPYPWARSVNGLAFAPTGGKFGPFEGQLVLCEYNNRFLLRASLEEVDGATQGACYPFIEEMLGPLAVAFAPDGSLYVASLREPAWGGEPEQGALYRVRFSGRPVFGIREVKALPDGFALILSAPHHDRGRVLEPGSYRVRRYRHVYQGAYHSPPTDEQEVTVSRVTVSADGLTIHLTLREPHLADRLYEIRTTIPDAEPGSAHYTMNRVPPVAATLRQGAASPPRSSALDPVRPIAPGGLDDRARNASHGRHSGGTRPTGAGP